MARGFVFVPARPSFLTMPPMAATVCKIDAGVLRRCGLYSDEDSKAESKEQGPGRDPRRPDEESRAREDSRA